MGEKKPPQREAPNPWGGAGGGGWVALQGILDGLFRPIEERIVAALPPRSQRVLDVGCGTGATTVAIAQQLGARCTGIDLSEPMITAALARAAREGAPAEFILADAQTHPLEATAYDAITSRFGVMFFRDPVAAFANLRRAARPGAPLRMVAWRSAGENPFMTAAEEAAAPLLPSLPKRQPDEPGQFGFADAGRVRRILSGSGWAEIDLSPLDVPCAFPRDAQDAYLSQLGPVGRHLQTEPEDVRARVLAAVRPAFDAYLHGDEIRFTAACWMIGARAEP